MMRVESSSIYAIGYDDQMRMLFVRFRGPGPGTQTHPGALYRYVKVPRTVWTRMQKASSFGRYLGDRVKGKYGYSRWTGRTWRPEAVLRVIAAKDRRLRILKSLRKKKRRSG